MFEYGRLDALRSSRFLWRWGRWKFKIYYCL